MGEGLGGSDAICRLTALLEPPHAHQPRNSEIGFFFFKENNIGQN